MDALFDHDERSSVETKNAAFTDAEKKQSQLHEERLALDIAPLVAELDAIKVKLKPKSKPAKTQTPNINAQPASKPSRPAKKAPTLQASNVTLLSTLASKNIIVAAGQSKQLGVIKNTAESQALLAGEDLSQALRQRGLSPDGFFMLVQKTAQEKRLAFPLKAIDFDRILNGEFLPNPGLQRFFEVVLDSLPIINASEKYLQSAIYRRMLMRVNVNKKNLLADCMAMSTELMPYAAQSQKTHAAGDDISRSFLDKIYNEEDFAISPWQAHVLQTVLHLYKHKGLVASRASIQMPWSDQLGAALKASQKSKGISDHRLLDDVNKGLRADQFNIEFTRGQYTGLLTNKANATHDLGYKSPVFIRALERVIAAQPDPVVEVVTAPQPSAPAKPKKVATAIAKPKDKPVDKALFSGFYLRRELEIRRVNFRTFGATMRRLGASKNYTVDLDKDLTAQLLAGDVIPNKHLQKLLQLTFKKYPLPEPHKLREALNFRRQFQALRVAQGTLVDDAEQRLHKIKQALPADRQKAYKDITLTRSFIRDFLLTRTPPILHPLQAKVFDELLQSYKAQTTDIKPKDTRINWSTEKAGKLRDFQTPPEAEALHIGYEDILAATNIILKEQGRDPINIYYLRGMAADGVRTKEAPKKFEWASIANAVEEAMYRFERIGPHSIISESGRETNGLMTVAQLVTATKQYDIDMTKMCRLCQVEMDQYLEKQKQQGKFVYTKGSVFSRHYFSQYPNKTLSPLQSFIVSEVFAKYYKFSHNMTLDKMQQFYDTYRQKGNAFQQVFLKDLNAELEEMRAMISSDEAKQFVNCKPVSRDKLADLLKGKSGQANMLWQAIERLYNKKQGQLREGIALGLQANLEQTERVIPLAARSDSQDNVALPTQQQFERAG